MKIGLIIPTIFSRPELLPLAAQSIQNQGVDVELLVACPRELTEKVSASLPRVRVIAEAPGLPLAEKINQALRQLPESCEYICWLGDDDLLMPGALASAAAELDRDPECVLVYGGIDYIDPSGKKLFTNPSSQFHASLLSFGPQLIPQPGALWRRDAFEKAGGLSGEFNLAFDFDFFLRLKKLGKLKHVPVTLAQFRWHPDSLSVKRRWVSVSEASRVRRKHYSGPMRVLWPLWEPFVMLATWLAGKLVSLRARRT